LIVSKFTLALIRSAEIPSLLKNLHTLSQLKGILPQISKRLVNVNTLLQEVSHISHRYNITRKNLFHLPATSSSSGAFLQITVSNNSTLTRFSVVFELGWWYPFGEVSSFVNVWFGSAQEEEILNIISDCKGGFGRLKKICLALQQFADGQEQIDSVGLIEKWKKGINA
jgi:hypothetical protein